MNKEWFPGERRLELACKPDSPLHVIGCRSILKTALGVLSGERGYCTGTVFLCVSWLVWIYCSKLCLRDLRSSYLPRSSLCLPASENDRPCTLSVCRISWIAFPFQGCFLGCWTCSAESDAQQILAPRTTGLPRRWVAFCAYNLRLGRVLLC